jgi:hypothetical protein
MRLSDKAARTDGPRAAPTAMPRRFIAAVALAITPFTLLWAQSADPLKSTECKAALGELEAVLGEKTQGPVRAQRVAAARRQAALACLGRGGESGVRSGAPNPPQTVPPPAIAAAPPVPPRPANAPAPPLAIPRPTVITTCDPAGCWDSEGRRLDNLGPLLMGPRGPCTAQGGLANCP